MADWLLLGFWIFLGLLSAAMWPMILLSRKQPISMIAWLLSVTLLPLVGPVFYLVVGTNRERWGLPRKKRRADVRIRGSLREVVPQVSRGTADLSRVDPTSASLLQMTERAGFDPVTGGNCAELLTHGSIKYDQLFEDIAAAKHHIHLEYFILREDSTGQRLAETLGERAAAGVEVRLLLDGFGSRALSYTYLARLNSAGVRVEWFHPMNPFRRRWSLNIRNHRKVALVDGLIGYVGGINLGDDYLGMAPEVGEWFDLAVRLRGPAVHSLQQVFGEDWHFATGEQLLEKKYYHPVKPCPEDTLVQIVTSGPTEMGEGLHQVYFNAITQARKRAWLTTPYFIPDEAFQAALCGAALRGVDVRVFVPQRTRTRLVDLASRSFIRQLLEAEVPIYHFRANAMLHAKALLIDDAFMVIGSANLDQRSFRVNFETGAVVWDEAMATELEDYFELLRQNARLLSPEDYHHRTWGRRTTEMIGRLLSPLF